MTNPSLTREQLQEAVDAVHKCGSQVQAAMELGIARGTLQNRCNRAVMEGIKPSFDYAIPDGHKIKGVSTLYNKDGDVTQRWLKTDIDVERQREMLQEAAKAFVESLPKYHPTKKPKGKYNTDIIPWFQIGDGHLGMLAHEAETGENFDLKIGERELCAAIGYLIEETPPCARCVIHDLGDMTHYENFSATTEASGHALDFDSRFPRMITVYARAMRYIVEKALERFETVDVIINQGNHSRTNDIWMRTLLQHVYQDSGRVNVLDNASVYIPYRMGNTFVMTHHSDKCKPSKLAHVMATDFAQDWGESKYRYIDIGHIHHNMVVKEHPGVHIESWNQLAAPDKYAHDGGWRSRQSITRVDRSKTYGEVGRRTMPILEVRDRIIAAHGHQGSEPPERRRVFTV